MRNAGWEKAFGVLLGVLLAGRLGWGEAEAADLPDAEKAVLSYGSVVDVAVTADGGALVAVSSSGSLTVLDLRDPWGGEVSTSVCASPRAVSLGYDQSWGVAWVSCDGGEVWGVSFDFASAPLTLGTSTSYVVSADEGELTALAASPDGSTVYIAERTGNSYDPVHALDVASQEVDGGEGLPAYVQHDASMMVMDPYGSFLLVAGQDGKQTTFTVSAGYLYTGTPTILYSGSDLVDGVALDSTTAWVLDGTLGSLYAVSLAGGYGTYTTLTTEPSESSSLAAMQDEDQADWFAVGQEDSTLAWVERATGAMGEAFSLSASAESLAGTPSGDGYLFAGASSGVLVITGNPWVTITSVSPETVSGDETVTLEFVSDEEGSYNACIGSGMEAAALDCPQITGTAPAGEAVEVSVTPSGLPEGVAWLTVFVTDDQGNVGRDAISLTVDTPPDAVAGVEAGFGDGRLVYAFTAGDEEDLSGYRVYFGEGELSEEAGPQGFSHAEDGAAVASPLWVEHPGSGVTVEGSISPLANGVRYCFVVAAVDQAGAEGPWSGNACETPASTGGWGALTGSSEGCQGCSSTRMRDSSCGFLLLLLAMAWGGRRGGSRG